MTTTITVESVLERIDMDALREAARQAAVSLKSTGFARVLLEPGDASRYGITVVSGEAEAWSTAESGCTAERTWCGASHLLAVDHGKVYPWNAEYQLEHGYVGEKWDLRPWDAIVVTAFINELSNALGS